MVVFACHIGSVLRTKVRNVSCWVILGIAFNQLLLFVQKQCKRRYGPQVVTAKIELKPPPYMLVSFNNSFHVLLCGKDLQMNCFKFYFQRFEYFVHGTDPIPTQS